MKKILIALSVAFIGLIGINTSYAYTDTITVEERPTQTTLIPGSLSMNYNELKNTTYIYINNELVFYNDEIIPNDYVSFYTTNDSQKILVLCVGQIAENTDCINFFPTDSDSSTAEPTEIQYKIGTTQFNSYPLEITLRDSEIEPTITESIFDNLSTLVIGVIGLFIGIFADNGVIGIFWNSADGGSLSLLSHLMLIGIGFYLVRWAFKQIIRLLRLKGAI